MKVRLYKSKLKKKQRKMADSELVEKFAEMINPDPKRFVVEITRDE